MTMEQKKKKCCAAKADPFTAEELDIFKKLRALRDEADGLKEILKTLENPAEKEAVENRLAEIRDEWKQLKQDGEAARKRRMILLGHLDPDGESE